MKYWADLYLVAFGPLRRVFNGRELNRMADAMVERGIRLRRGLEEIEEGLEVEGDEMSDNGDEIEEDANELRRLMPY